MMEETLKQLKKVVAQNGFASIARLKVEASILGLNNKEAEEALLNLKKDPDIKIVEYTNSYVAKYCKKELLTFNPNTGNKNVPSNSSQ